MSKDNKCSICGQREIELIFNADLQTTPGYRFYKKIAPAKMCRICADRTMENVCFIIDQPNEKII